MKKSLLFACLALSTTTFAQFSDPVSPQIGDGATMYVIDTNVTNYSGTTGSGVTWDYSGALGVASSAVKSVGVNDATMSAEASNYPGSTIEIDIPGFITTYNKSTATDYSSQGFIFSDGTSTYKVKLDTDDEDLMTYPAVQGNSWSDIVSGHVEALSQNIVCSGTANTEVDGSGTLILNSATTLTGVLRFKIVDSMYANVFPLGDVTMKRTQYEYYHHASSHLPVFIHSSIDMVIGGGAPQTTGIVLSVAMPDGFLAVKSEELTGVSVYPNPATEVINFNGLTEDATIQIFALNGQLIKTVELAMGTSSIAIDELTSGTYLVKATTANGTLTTKVTVK